MPTLLDALCNDSAKKVEDFYTKYPFALDKMYQYPGNVIQYLLKELAKIDTTNDHNDRSKSYWLSYKQTVLHKIYALFPNLTSEPNSFSARDSAIALHRLSAMHTNDLRLIPLNVPIFLALIEKLYNERRQANSEDISNVLWGIAKLLEAGIVIAINPQHLEALIAILVETRHLAKSQEISNSLWAVAQLIEIEIISAVNLQQIDKLQQILEKTEQTQRLPNRGNVAKRKENEALENVSRREFKLAYGKFLVRPNQAGLTPLHLALSVADADDAMEYLGYLKEAYNEGNISKKTYRNLLTMLTPEKLNPLQLAAKRGDGRIIEYLIHELILNFSPHDVTWHLILAIQNCSDRAIKENLQKKREELSSLKSKPPAKTLLFTQKEHVLDCQGEPQQSGAPTI